MLRKRIYRVENPDALRFDDLQLREIKENHEYLGGYRWETIRLTMLETGS